MALCLVYLSSSQCDALYVQLFAVQFNFINTSFNNTTMNYVRYLVDVKDVVVNTPFRFLTIISVL